LEPGLERKYGRLVVVGRDSLPGRVSEAWGNRLIVYWVGITGGWKPHSGTAYISNLTDFARLWDENRR